MLFPCWGRTGIFLTTSVRTRIGIVREAHDRRDEPRVRGAARHAFHVGHPDQRVRAVRQLRHRGRTRAARPHAQSRPRETCAPIYPYLCPLSVCFVCFSSPLLTYSPTILCWLRYNTFRCIHNKLVMSVSWYNFHSKRRTKLNVCSRNKIWALVRLAQIIT